MSSQLFFHFAFCISIAATCLLGCSKHSPPAIASVSDKEAQAEPITANGPNSNEVVLSTPPPSVRFATYNVSLYRKRSGQLIDDLASGKSEQAHNLATVIQHARPDVLLLNEFDYDSAGVAAEAFCKLYLGTDHEDTTAIKYPYRFFAESNTGIPSGMDLDNNGRMDDPADCFGYGVHAGQYGMLVLSKHPIDRSNVRTFQKFLWKDMPNAKLPIDASTNEPYYSEQELAVLRLSSKSHWDVPITIGESTIHFLVSHPTPPVFDGAEDRNGKRNHDEIRLFADYIDPDRSRYLTDDQGRTGGLPANSQFVIAGDLNADPIDGDSSDGAARQLVDHPLVRSSPIPSSEGAVAFAEQGVNADHRGDPAHDTGDFDDRRSGNLRIDYVLPSRTLTMLDAGVFWPASDSELSQLVNATDHRLVWIEVQP